ncbi:GrpB family protein, partial [Planctomycetota bacterium]
AKEYSELKEKLSKGYSKDRVAYTEAKTDFIGTITERARQYYKNGH